MTTQISLTIDAFDLSLETSDIIATWSTVESDATAIDVSFNDSIVLTSEESARVLAPSLPAHTALSALRVVFPNSSQRWQYADPSNTLSGLGAIALTTTAAIANTATSPIFSGTVTDMSWNWTIGVPIFLGANGTLTQAAPSSGVCRVVALPIDPDRILFNPEKGMFLE